MPKRAPALEVLGRGLLSIHAYGPSRTAYAKSTPIPNDPLFTEAFFECLGQCRQDLVQIAHDSIPR
jgi:hypothetical protein